MPFQITNPELEQALMRHADRQPFRSSKVAIVEAILKKAAAMPPEQFDTWISSRDQEASCLSRQAAGQCQDSASEH